MNYNKIYNALIERAKTRIITEYIERHHIIPRCIGGDDSSHNLVNLTPEEHYVAHQLLVKMYPTNYKLVKAAAMMIPSRKSNKLYGWLRRKLSDVQRIEQLGTNNSQYGSKWVYNETLKECKKIHITENIPDGWVQGRVINWDKKEDSNKHNECPNCGTLKKVERKFCSLSCATTFNNKKKSTIFDNHLEDMIADFKSGTSIHKCLKIRNFCGNGANYTRLKLELQNRGLV